MSSFKKIQKLSCLLSKFCYRKGQPEKKQAVCVNVLQTKCVSGVPLESACRSARKQFVFMEYSGVCYNEQFLSIKSGYYNERGGILSADGNKRVRMTCQDSHPKEYELRITPLLRHLCDF